MLDSFEIITTSGVVLWSRNYTFVSPNIVNKFINDVFIEESASVTASASAAGTGAGTGAATGAKDDLAAALAGGSCSSHAPFFTDQYAVQWTFAKDLGVLFVAVYKSLLHLSWVGRLVDNIRAIFVNLYGDQLTRPNTTIVECVRFDDYFDQQLSELEGNPRSAQMAFTTEKAPEQKLQKLQKPPEHQPSTPASSSAESTSIVAPTHSRPSTPSGVGAGSTTSVQPCVSGKVSRRARKAQSAATAAASGHTSVSASGDEAPVARKTHHTGKTAKKGRKWGVDGMAEEDDGSDVQLDYSAMGATTAEVTPQQNLENVDTVTWGTTAKGGKFVLRDLGDEVHSILASESAKQGQAKKAAETGAAGGLLGSGLSTIGGLFRNVVGGKILTKDDLDRAMKGMEEHLLRKNVAREAAVRLCESVEAELLGTKTGNFESINARVKTALEGALTKMLTPTSSLDLLREIDAIVAPSSSAANFGRSTFSPRRPYVMSIVGVNGVGKSTNLSKICFFLLQNRYKVLIAAGDTFRSGAVEQLAVHVRNLQELTARQLADGDDGASGQQRQAKVELYQRGYGKDAATVAKDAVAFAAQEGYDVVLIDTAGRRHNDARLMASLEKFAKLARPDKIIMVGEALVGTDSVAQARSFNAAFGGVRMLDGFLISKCDTVGSMVGTLVSLVHATNVPIAFVGVGQHYSDLRNFSVKWAVERLLNND